MSESFLPCVSAANGVPRRSADSEMLRSDNGAERGCPDLCDDLPVQLREWGSAYVLRMGDWLKMLRVHTGRVAAQMVKLKSIGNRADLLFVEASVRAVFLTPDPDGAVTPLTLGRKVPYPTGGVVPTVGDCPKFGGHPFTPSSHTSGVSGEKAARLSRYKSFTPECSCSQLGLLAASALAQHRLSVSKGGGSY